MSPYFRAKEEALKHRAVKDDDDDDVAKSIEIMVWKIKRAVLFVRDDDDKNDTCLLYTSPSPRDQRGSRMPSSA